MAQVIRNFRRLKLPNVRRWSWREFRAGGDKWQIERLLVPAEYSQGIARPLESGATQ